MKSINKNNTKSISISPLKKMFKYEYDRAKKEGLSSIAYEKINYLKEIPKLYKTWKTNKGYKPISINVYNNMIYWWRANVEKRYRRVGSNGKSNKWREQL